jgi:hypothetical protein
MFLLAACGGGSTSTVDPAAQGPVDEQPEAPQFATGPGTFQLAWTSELSDATRPGPPLVAGTSITVLSVDPATGSATVRTDEDPPRTGKLPVTRLISGTRMQPGVLTVDSSLRDGLLETSPSTPILALTAVLPYQAKTGFRAVVDADGRGRWLPAEGLQHDPKDLAVAREVAAARWHAASGDTRSARQRLRGLGAIGDGSPVFPVARDALAAELGLVHLLDAIPGIVHDPASGLTWRRCADGQGWADDDGRCTGGGVAVGARSGGGGVWVLSRARGRVASADLRGARSTDPMPGRLRGRDLDPVRGRAGRRRLARAVPGPGCPRVDK